MKRQTGRIWCVSLVLGLAAAALAAGPPARAAEQPVRVTMARLSFPSHVALILDIVKDQGFDRKHGLDMELRSFGTVGAFYAAQATGEAEGGIAGPLVMQRMRLEGAPMVAVATCVDMTSEVVIARDPKVQSLTDLKGKTLAADVAASEYQILSVVAKGKGLVMGKDVTVVPAGPPMARTQLAADRVDAAMTWEPSATLTLRDNPANRIVWNAKQGWREMTGKDGWLLLVSMHDAFIKRNPQVVPRVVAAFQDGARFMKTNPDEADRIVAKSLNLPPGIFKEMILAPRVVYDVRPAWEPATRDSIWEMFRVAVHEGYLKDLPDPGILHTP